MNKTNQYISETIKVVWIILVLNLAVVVIELFAGVITKSLSILGGALHSIGDALNNVAGGIVLKFASEPPDKKHPYGHGKFETLAAFAIVIFLAIAAVEIIKSSIGRLMHPVKLPIFSKEAVWLLILTLGINLAVWVYERHKGKELKSDFLIADSSHTGSDVLITISVLASQYFIAKEMYWVDPVVAILIAGLIGKAGYEIVTRTVPILVDEVWLEPNEIKNAVLSVNNVLDCYDIYSRHSPHSAYIECKIKVIPKDLFSAHKIADDVESKLKNSFGECKITVHIEP